MPNEHTHTHTNSESYLTLGAYQKNVGDRLKKCNGAKLEISYTRKKNPKRMQRLQSSYNVLFCSIKKNLLGKVLQKFQYHNVD